MNADGSFTAQNGFVYESFAARLQNKPKDCWQNDETKRFLAQGKSKAFIQAYFRVYNFQLQRFSHSREAPDRTAWQAARICAHNNAFQAATRHDADCSSPG